MSMVQQLISSVTNAERQLDEQISKLNSYLIEVDNVSMRVDNAFAGSSVNYGQRMIQQLAQTKEQVRTTIGTLQAAKDKLAKVRMI